MSDPRNPLLRGAAVPLDGRNYIIREAIGFGGSCIAYSAERQPNDYERGIGVTAAQAVIKEFYPLGLADGIERVGLKLNVMPGVSDFEERKKRFECGAKSQVAFYAEDGNHSLPPARIDAANGTVYSVVDWASGCVLANNTARMTMYEISEVMISLCNAVKKLHDENKLYLDIKPSNIFLFGKEQSESRRIALFDFDTVLQIDELETAAISYSETWSPPELVFERRDKISFASDIYSIGAVFYWLVIGRKVTNETLNNIKRGDFTFLDDCAPLVNMKNARISTEKILAATLRRESEERTQSVKWLLYTK